MKYEKPVVTDFGSVASHTFQTPGAGTKNSDTTYDMDDFGEFSHPAAGS